MKRFLQMCGVVATVAALLAFLFLIPPPTAGQERADGRAGGSMNVANIVGTGITNSGGGIIVGIGDGDWRSTIAASEAADTEHTIQGGVSGGIALEGGYVGGSFVGEKGKCFMQASYGGVAVGEFLNASNSWIVSRAGSFAGGPFDYTTNCWYVAGNGSWCGGDISVSSNCNALAYPSAICNPFFVDARDSSLRASYGSQANINFNLASNCFVEVRNGSLAQASLSSARDVNIRSGLDAPSGSAISVVKANVAQRITATNRHGLLVMNVGNPSAKTDVMISINNAIVLARPPTGYTNTALNDCMGILAQDGIFYGFKTNGLVGRTNGVNAGAGIVGEYGVTNLAVGAALALVTTVPTNIATLSLTAGDWDVEGNVNITTTSSTLTATSGGIGTTTQTVPTDGSEVYSGLQLTTASVIDSMTVPRKQINVTATTTVYLVVNATFSAGSVSAFGSLTARRK